MRIVKFQTESCIPCKIVDNMLNEMGLKVDEVIDIENNEQLREKYIVMNVPTVMLLDSEDVEVTRVVGLDKEKIENLFREAGRLS